MFFLAFKNSFILLIVPQNAPGVSKFPILSCMPGMCVWGGHGGGDSGVGGEGGGTFTCFDKHPHPPQHEGGWGGILVHRKRFVSRKK